MLCVVKCAYDYGAHAMWPATPEGEPLAGRNQAAKSYTRQSMGFKGYIMVFSLLHCNLGEVVRSGGRVHARFQPAECARSMLGRSG